MFNKILKSKYFIGVASFALSVLFITIIVISFSNHVFPEYRRFKSNSPQPTLKILGRNFTPLTFGSGHFQNGSAVITKLENGEAVLLAKNTLEANFYPFVEWKAEGLSEGLQIRLFWRRNEDQSTLHSAKLPFNNEDTHVLDLAKHPEWRGKVVEIALGVFGDLRDRPFIFKQIIFTPFSMSRAISVIPQQWSYSNKWIASSVNYSTGTISREHIHPAATFGMLSILSLIFVKIITDFFFRLEGADKNKTLGNALAVSLFFCWITLDIFRMSGRIAQAVETQFLFSDKPLAERASNAEGRCFIMSSLWHERTLAYARNELYRRDCSFDIPLPNF